MNKSLSLLSSAAALLVASPMLAAQAPSWSSSPDLQPARLNLAVTSTERTHQGIGNEKIRPVPHLGAGPVQCHERLGGILKSYQRAA